MNSQRKVLNIAESIIMYESYIILSIISRSARVNKDS